MSNISDIIEDFLVQSMGDSETIDISRNELANFFNVAPSQINYVLTTRFNYERGFLTESRRGGGGYITITRTKDNNDEWLKSILNETLKHDLDLRSGQYLIEELEKREVLSAAEADILRSAISSQALNNPFRVDNKIRANIIKKALIDKVQKGGEV